jgi:large repetitive protein
VKKHAVMLFVLNLLVGVLFSIAAWAEPFTASGPMLSPSSGHTATLLQDGKVLVTKAVSGGLIGAEVYDPATGTFTASTGHMNHTRWGYTATLLPNGKVLIAGGYKGDGSDFVTTAELYDPSTGIFTDAGVMTSPRVSCSAILLPTGKVLLAGGQASIGSNNFLSTNTAELYDPVTGIFTATGNMTTKRSYYTATLLRNGEVLLVGGEYTELNGSIISVRPLNAADVYNPATGTFTAAPGHMNHTRLNHTATLLPDGNVLIAGTDGAYYSLNYAELYNPATGYFTATGNMTTARADHTATLLPDGKVLVAGGSDGYNYLSNAEVYDPATGTFTATKDNMTSERGSHTATMLQSGKVLIAGGTSGTVMMPVVRSSTELYDPAATTASILAASLTYGANATVTVSVGAMTGTPTGSVALSLDNGTATTQALSNGSATFTITKPTAGSHTLTATYAAQNSFPASSSSGTLSVSPRTLTVTVTGNNKAYDGTTTATVTFGDNRVSGDSFTVFGTAAFYDPNVGTAKTITVTNIYANGTDAGNYAVSSTTATATANITSPAAPLIAAFTPTKSTAPTWTWTTGGVGNGIFRYKLDSSSLTSGATVTTAKAFTPVTALSEGSHTLYVQENNNAGLWSSIGSKTVVIDVTPPETTILTKPASLANSATATFTLATTGGSSYQCSIDGGAFVTCTSTKTYSSLAEGNHSFSVKAVDAAGNEDPTPATYAWTIDRTPPVAPVVTSITPTTSTTPTWTWRASGGGNGTFRYKLDGLVWSANITATTFSPATALAPGAHTLWVQEIDDAGNWSVSGSKTVVIDMAPPETTITYKPALLVASSTATFSFSSTEGGRFQCSLDGAEYASCTSSKIYPGLADGSHTFSVKATDAAGNEDPTPASYTWTIDTTPLAAPINLDVTLDSGVTLTWTDTAANETGYHIYRRENTDVVWTKIGDTGPSITTYIDSTAALDTTYVYYVAVYNWAHVASSNTVAITTLRLSPPVSVVATIAAGGVDLMWKDRSLGESGNEVWRRGSVDANWSKIATLGANTTSYLDLGVSALNLYQVCATTASGGKACSSATITGAPTVFAATYQAGNGVSLSWTDGTSDEIGFRVYRKRTEESAYALVATPGQNVTTYVDGSSGAGTFNYKICPYNAIAASCSAVQVVVVP